MRWFLLLAYAALSMSFGLFICDILVLNTPAYVAVPISLAIIVGYFIALYRVSKYFGFPDLVEHW